MAEPFITSGGFNRPAFEADVLAELDGFKAVATAMNQTQSRLAAPEHFLMALLGCPTSGIVVALAARDVTPAALLKHVGQSVTSGWGEAAFVLHKDLTPDRLAPEAAAVFRTLAD